MMLKKRVAIYSEDGGAHLERKKAKQPLIWCKFQ